MVGAKHVCGVRGGTKNKVMPTWRGNLEAGQWGAVTRAIKSALL